MSQIFEDNLIPVIPYVSNNPLGISNLPYKIVYVYPTYASCIRRVKNFTSRPLIETSASW